MSINDKIKQVLTIKNLSPSYLADDIGVQRSSISHILSGRNRPSLDIIQKIVRRFPEFTYEWFLESDIQLSTDGPSGQPTQNTQLPQRSPTRADKLGIGDRESANQVGETHRKDSTIDQNRPVVPIPNNTLKPLVERILIFYTDGTFREYRPASNLQD